MLKLSRVRSLDVAKRWMRSDKSLIDEIFESHQVFGFTDTIQVPTTNANLIFTLHKTYQNANVPKFLVMVFKSALALGNRKGMWGASKTFM